MCIPKLFFIMMVILIYLLLVLLTTPYAASFTFNLTNVDQNNLQGILAKDAAYVTEDGIQLTSEEYHNGSAREAGRVTYNMPLHLWDKSTNELASFSTSFTFVIDSKFKVDYGDGLTFFLAQDNSVIQGGGAMGLPVDNLTSMTVTNPFVAVEFDTYGSNEWDTNDYTGELIGNDHVGININSLKSVAFRNWSSNIPYGILCQAWINYDSLLQNLSVSFTDSQDDTTVFEFSPINLRKVLPEWVIFGFSAATGDKFEKHHIQSWSFNSSDLQIDKGQPPTTTQNIVKGKNGSGVSMKLIVIVGCVGFVIVVLAAFTFFWWKKKSKGDGVTEIDTDGTRKFSYHELARSTSNFAEEQKLGEGGFGGVYKGFLKDSSMHIAVKRVSKTSQQGFKEFEAEVRIISSLSHRNLVRLKGWCHEKRELLLVYDFMENRSLDSHLFKPKSLLAWGTRYKIAQGLASALLYLHEECKPYVLHRDIKSSNVMLDSNFEAKLGDFGLAKLVDHDISLLITRLAGTEGYVAPECYATGITSKESDVFSFGVVALEIACGRKPLINHHAQENQKRLVQWVWELYETTGTPLEAADPSLLQNSDSEVDEIKLVMMVGLFCAHPDPEKRPSIRRAHQILIREASLPVLTPRKPMATSSSDDSTKTSLHVTSSSDDSTKTSLHVTSSN